MTCIKCVSTPFGVLSAGDDARGLQCGRDVEALALMANRGRCRLSARPRWMRGMAAGRRAAYSRSSQATLAVAPHLS